MANNLTPLQYSRKFIFVLNKWFHFYVRHKRELANEITGIFTCIISTWGTLRHRYSAGGRSHWIEHAEPGFSNFAVLRFMTKLSFCISNSILHHAVIYRASRFATKGSNWILQLGLPYAVCYGLCRFTFDFPARVGLVQNDAWLRSNLDYIVTLEPSEFCNDWHQWLYHGNHYVLWVIEICNAFKLVWCKNRVEMTNIEMICDDECTS